MADRQKDGSGHPADGPTALEYFQPLFKLAGIGLTVFFATLGLAIVAALLWF
jgi:hypothetical protein